METKAPAGDSDGTDEKRRPTLERLSMGTLIGYFDNGVIQAATNRRSQERPSRETEALTQNQHCYAGPARTVGCSVNDPPLMRCLNHAVNQVARHAE